VPPRAPRK